MVDIQNTSLGDILNETEKSTEDTYKYNFCRRCGRQLKKPENRLRGMGPVCWERSHLEQSRRLFDADSDAPI